MMIDPVSNSSYLRLVRPTEEAGPVQPVARVRKVSSTKSEDVSELSTLQQNALPMVQLSDAQKKLEILRSQLVAGKTDVPIHFEQPTRPTTNPFAANYLRFSPAPADVNGSATDRIDLKA